MTLQIEGMRKPATTNCTTKRLRANVLSNMVSHVAEFIRLKSTVATVECLLAAASLWVGKQVPFEVLLGHLVRLFHIYRLRGV